MSSPEATRRQALARGLVAGGALAAGSTAGLALARRALAQADDAALIERAIELEQEAQVLYEEIATGRPARRGGRGRRRGLRRPAG